MAKTNFYPVILAGGRGTRFWPLSRQRRAKQLLALDGKQTMIQQTVARLLPLASPARFWVITNEHLRREIMRQLPRLGRKQILAEPVGRNTAPAIGLAAFILMNSDPDAVIGLFPSDHVIADEKAVSRGLEARELRSRPRERISWSWESVPRAPRLATATSRPAPPLTGDALRVRRFTEKPDAARAAEFVKAGNYFWNSGMFLWSARTLANALLEHLPKTAALLQQIAATFGTRKFAATFARLYPKCENISIDYAVLEPRSGKGEQNSNIICLPADFGWNDLGSWTALHEHHTAKQQPKDDNLIAAEGWFTLNAAGQLHSRARKICGSR